MVNCTTLTRLVHTKVIRWLQIQLAGRLPGLAWLAKSTCDSEINQGSFSVYRIERVGPPTGPSSYSFSRYRGVSMLWNVESTSSKSRQWELKFTSDWLHCNIHFTPTARPDKTVASPVWIGQSVALNAFTLRIFRRRQSWVVENPIHTADADAI